MLPADIQELLARILVPGVLGIAALITLAQYFSTRRRHLWPRTTGRIISSQVRPAEITRRGKKKTVYFPVVTTSFEVEGRKFQIDRIARIPVPYDKEESARIIADVFIPGSETPVYYNPRSPEEAYLVPGGEVGGALLVWISLSLLVIDAVWTWLLFTR
jgi:hypothetical protein